MNRPYDSPARRALKRLCTLLGLTLAVMFAVTLQVQNLMAQADCIRIRDIPKESLELPKISFQSMLSDLQQEKIGGFGSGIVNVLLVGQDRREGEDTARSDSMILCTYHRKNGTLVMTSFLRDLYVPIPGHGSNRINAAYATGGMDLLEETLEQNFSLHIDGSVEVDFSQFSGIIDLLGGAEIELRQDEAELINQETGSALTEGKQLLDGQQTLLYSRIRSLDSDGDFSRTNRQRKVLSALLSNCRSAGFQELVALVEALMPLISTDMSKVELLTLALELLPNLTQLEITSQHVPAPGTYTDETIDGMAVLSADTGAIREMLKKTLLGQ